MILKSEFKTALHELIEEGLVTKESKKYDLKVIAIPASIDNDISNTDMTLGADSALHRIIESVDKLSTTMASHQRCFVVEVMGRSCGWISLMSFFTTGADYVFMPETPTETWKEDMLSCINYGKQNGKKGSIIIVSEGAIDISGKKINVDDIKALIDQEIGMDTRVVKLGHVQRGGAPSAFDRIMSTLFGIKAVEFLLSDQDTLPYMIALKGREYCKVNLQKVLEDNEKIAKYQANNEYEKILYERGKIFNRLHEISLKIRAATSNLNYKRKIAVVHEGSRSGGMNVALNMIVRYANLLNQEIHVIQEGLEGSLQNQIKKTTGFEYLAGIRDGGSIIGSSFSKTLEPEMIYNKLKEHKIDSLVIIGGSDVLMFLNRLKKIIEKKNEHKVDVVLLPATVDNNVPYTDMCLGADTALNCIDIGCDFLRLSSMSMKETVFVVEVPGKESGYLALMGGIAAGAFDYLLPERKYLINHLSETAERLKYMFKKGNRHGILLIKNQTTFSNVGIDAFSKILATDSNGLYDVKYSVLGYLVEGGCPSPYDRICASISGVKTVEMLLKVDNEKILKEQNTAFVGILGFKGQYLKFTNIDKVCKRYKNTQEGKVKPPWMMFSNICRSME
ncbi:hypothetical protein BDAP_001933 [Binucleata daphniae]